MNSHDCGSLMGNRSYQDPTDLIFLMFPSCFSSPQIQLQLFISWPSWSDNHELNFNIQNLRAWLRLIRGAQESLHIYASDLFAENGPHRSWLGLKRWTTLIINHRQVTRSQPESSTFTEELRNSPLAGIPWWIQFPSLTLSLKKNERYSVLK